MVAFKAVLDALIAKNYSAKAEIAIPASPSASPEGQRSGGKKSTDVLTPRRREMAGVYADELISGFISKHRDASGAFSPPKRAASPPKTCGASERGEEKRADGSFRRSTGSAQVATPPTGEPTMAKPKRDGSGKAGAAEGGRAGGRGGGAGGRGGPPSRQEQMDRSPPRQTRPPASRPTTAGQGRPSSELPRPARMPPPKSRE